MKKPIVAVVGRPNVGKSTLFNAISGKNISIVKDTPSVTRDRIYADANWSGQKFTLIDTGGIEIQSDNYILQCIKEQAQIAIDIADVILFITDVKTGILDTDFMVADILRRSKKPIILVVNKVDNFEKYMMDVYEFYNLGIGQPYPVSSTGKMGIGDILDKVIEYLPKFNDEDENEDIIKIAVIGKPNVGKSSLINYILKEERLIVSDTAGTTRDSIDANVKYANKEYLFIDTAGLRKKSKIEDDIEKYSMLRAISSVNRCDVALLMIDAKIGITQQDAKIAGLAHNEGKGLIVAVNKWDDIEKDTKTSNKYIDDIRRVLPFASYSMIVFISAKTGQRINKLFDTIDMVYDSCHTRIATGILNEVLSDAVAMSEPPQDKGKQLKLFYITQVSIKPPTFILFVNDKTLMHFSYERYLENRLREAFLFKGTPIKIIVRQKGDKNIA